MMLRVYATAHLHCPTQNRQKLHPHAMLAGGVLVAGIPTHKLAGADQLAQVLLQEWASDQGRHHHPQQHRLLQRHHGPGLLLTAKPTARHQSAHRQAWLPATLLHLIAFPLQTCCCATFTMMQLWAAALGGSRHDYRKMYSFLFFHNDALAEHGPGHHCWHLTMITCCKLDSWPRQV